MSRFAMRNMKKKRITVEELEWLKEKVGSYEGLFSKRAQKYRQFMPKGAEPSEFEFRHLLLSEYTFLKRPVFVYKGKVFVGNSKQVVEEVYKAVNGK
jgi:arsenate reductase